MDDPQMFAATVGGAAAKVRRWMGQGLPNGAPGPAIALLATIAETLAEKGRVDAQWIAALPTDDEVWKVACGQELMLCTPGTETFDQALFRTVRGCFELAAVRASGGQ